MTENKIWVVIRSQGEYSDRHETCVCWFPSQVAAQSFVEKATGQSRDAAQRWRKFEDALPEGQDYTEEVIERFSDGLIDQSFDPTGYDAEYAYYHIREVGRGSLS